MNEPKFTPKPGQKDFTNAKRAPTVTCVVLCGSRVLLTRRSERLRFYPGFWSGISGFLDDERGIEEKVKEELREEVNPVRSSRGALHPAFANWSWHSSPRQAAGHSASNGVNIGERNIIEVIEGTPFEQEDEKYNKTWIVHPVLVRVSSDTIVPNWEVEDYRWVDPEEIQSYELAPGFEKVVSMMLKEL